MPRPTVTYIRPSTMQPMPHSTANTASPRRKGSTRPSYRAGGTVGRDRCSDARGFDVAERRGEPISIGRTYTSLAVALLVLGSAGCGTVARPFPTASPSPPVGRVFYATDSPVNLNAVDWSGDVKRTYPLPSPRWTQAPYPGKQLAPTNHVEAVSPDGSRLLLSDGSIVDASLHAVGRLSSSGLTPMWADDATHLCQLTTPGYSSFPGGTLTGPAILMWVRPGSGAEQLATIGQFGAATSYRVAACSASAGTVVVVAETAVSRLLPPSTTSLIVVSIHDRRILYQRSYPAAMGYRVWVSPDGRFAAEVSAGTIIRPPALPIAPTLVRDLATGEVVSSLGPVYVKGWSADDSRVLTEPREGEPCDVLRWRTGEVIARTDFPAREVAAQPGGRAMLVLERDGANDELWLIGASGDQRLITRATLEVYGPSGAAGQAP